MELLREESRLLRAWLGTAGAAFSPACHAPFVTLSFQTSGLVYACSRKPSALVGDVRTQSLREIWDGPLLARLRSAIAADRFDDECLACGWFARRGMHEAADYRRYRHFAVPDPAPPFPRRLEFNLSNACNLECVHCSGELSSLIRARRDRLPPLPRVYGEKFFAELAEFLPDLEDACFLGGEPFVQPECFRIWDALLERKLSVRSLITTNGTRYDDRIARVLDELPFQLTVSLDGATKETVERIRVGARFEEILANLRRYRAHAARPGNRLLLAYALMRSNHSEFGDFVALAEEFDADVTLNVVTDPPEMSLFRLPAAELEPIVAGLELDLERRRAALPRNAAAFASVVELLRAHLERSAEEGFGAMLSESRLLADARRARREGAPS